MKSANACDFIAVVGTKLRSNWDSSVAHFPILLEASLLLNISPSGYDDGTVISCAWK